MVVFASSMENSTRLPGHAKPVALPESALGRFFLARIPVDGRLPALALVVFRRNRSRPAFFSSLVSMLCEMSARRIVRNVFGLSDLDSRRGNVDFYLLSPVVVISFIVI